MAVRPVTLEFYEHAAGRKPVLEWLRDTVSISTRRVIGTALREILQEQGMGVCGTSFGRQLGGGVFDRLREGNLLLRAFCHAYGAGCSTRSSRRAVRLSSPKKTLQKKQVSGRPR
jgi:hypothetical protein